MHSALCHQLNAQHLVGEIKLGTSILLSWPNERNKSCPQNIVFYLLLITSYYNIIYSKPMNALW